MLAQHKRWVLGNVDRYKVDTRWWLHNAFIQQAAGGSTPFRASAVKGGSSHMLKTLSSLSTSTNQSLSSMSLYTSSSPWIHTNFNKPVWQLHCRIAPFSRWIKCMLAKIYSPSGPFLSPQQQMKQSPRIEEVMTTINSGHFFALIVGAVLIKKQKSVMSWLRLQTRLECIPHPCHMYTKCFSTLICCG